MAHMDMISLRQEMSVVSLTANFIMYDMVYRLEKKGLQHFPFIKILIQSNSWDMGPAPILCGSTDYIQHGIMLNHKFQFRTCCMSRELDCNSRKVQYKVIHFIFEI